MPRCTAPRRAIQAAASAQPEFTGTEFKLKMMPSSAKGRSINSRNQMMFIAFFTIPNMIF